MKKFKEFYLVKLILKLALVSAFVIGFVFLIYLFINSEGEHKISVWQKIKDVPRVNFFKFFGWKWWITIILSIVIIGWFVRSNWMRVLEGWLERKKFFDFAQDVHMAMIPGEVGKGKTLLLSMLAKNLPHAIKKVGFISNVPDAKLLSYNDLNFDEPVPEEETYNIPKYYFVDETNFLIEGTSFIENRYYHKGVAWLLQICRHHKMRVWMSATRMHHIWASIRPMMNYYVTLGGLEYLQRFRSFTFFNQRVRFYSSQSDELIKEFNITVSNLDFALYDSYWLRGTRFFRPTYEGIAEEGRLKREKKRQEWEKKKKEELQRATKYQKEAEQKRKVMNKLVKVLKQVLEIKKDKGELKEEPLPNSEPIKTNYWAENSWKNNSRRKYRKSNSLQDFLKDYEKKQRK